MDRIKITDKKDALIVSISGRGEGWQRYSMYVWFTLWSLCGIVMVYTMFGEMARETRLSFVVYLCFWAWFEYKVGYAMLYKTYGSEYIKVSEGRLWYKRHIKGAGKMNSYFKDNFNGVDLLDYDSQKFVLSYNMAFWTISGERLFFTHKEKQISFGLQLTEEEAKDLKKRLNNKLRKM